MGMWYPIINATNTLAGAFGSLNTAVSGNILMNGDWFWTFISIGLFGVIELVFMRNGVDILQGTFVSSLIMLVITSILYSIGIIFIVMPLLFFLLVLASMSFSIATRPAY